VNLIRILIFGALVGAGIHDAVAKSGSVQRFSATVIAVLDGDTVLIRRKGKLVKIRLAEIDAPEKAQAFGEASKQSLSGMVLGKEVRVVSQAVDQYGRMVAHLTVNGLDVNAEQIRRGMAWEYSHFHSNQVLIVLQNAAKHVPRGLWEERNPTPPWIWRIQHSSTFSARSEGAVLSGAKRTNTASQDPGCGNKKYCSEMSSCEEAKYYFTRCGAKWLDGDGDGTPCERLCAPQNEDQKLIGR
jgi:endonuclease YncB( thermonuclease family)